MHCLGEFLGVDEDERLRHLAGLKHALDEVEFFLRLAAHLELLDVRQLQLLWLDFDLDSLRDEGGNALLNLLVLVLSTLREGR